MRRLHRCFSTARISRGHRVFHDFIDSRGSVRRQCRWTGMVARKSESRRSNSLCRGGLSLAGTSAACLRCNKIALPPSDAHFSLFADKSTQSSAIVLSISCPTGGPAFPAGPRHRISLCTCGRPLTCDKGRFAPLETGSDNKARAVRDSRRRMSLAIRIPPFLLTGPMDQRLG